MKQDQDWLKAVGEKLRDAETPLPEGGWERLAGELPAAVPGKPLWVRRWPRYAAAAAVVLVCLAVGDAYWRASRQVKTEIPEIAAVLSETAPETPPQAPAVAEAVPELAQAKPGKVTPRFGKMRADSKIDTFAPAAKDGGAGVPESGTPEPASAEPRVRTAKQNESSAAAENSGRQSEKRTAAQEQNWPDEANLFGEPLPLLRDKGVLFGARAGGALTSGGRQNGVLPVTVINAIGGMPAMDDLPGIAMGLPMQIDFTKCTYAHKQPLSFAFTVGKQFRYGLSLESGISYTLLRSDVTLPHASSDVSQTLHMLGIPVRLNWSWLNRGGFSLYLSGGGLVEKCIAARFGGEKIQEKAVQFSVFGALGAQYKLGKHVGLYFEPEVSYFFTETTLRTSRTDSPASFTLQLGVRFSY